MISDLARASLDLDFESLLKSNLDRALDWLEKGAGHKYLKRIATGLAKPKYRYVYSVNSKYNGPRGGDPNIGDKVKVKHKGEEGHYEVTDVHFKDGETSHVTIRHDESGHEAKVHVDHLHEMFAKEHKEAIQDKHQKLARIAQHASRTGTPKQQIRARSALRTLEDRFSLKEQPAQGEQLELKPQNRVTGAEAEDSATQAWRKARRERNELAQTGADKRAHPDHAKYQAAVGRVETALEAMQDTRASIKPEGGKPWTHRSSGVAGPHIGEISGVQRSRMSAAANRRYDADRAKRSAAAGNAHQGWRGAVIQSFKNGEFKLNDPDVTQEAKAVIIGQQVADDKANKAEKMHAAAAANRIRQADDHLVQPGVRVWTGYRSTGVVVKRNRGVVYIQTKSGGIEKNQLTSLLWEWHGTYEKAIDEGKPSIGQRIKAGEDPVTATGGDPELAAAHAKKQAKKPKSKTPTPADAPAFREYRSKQIEKRLGEGYSVNWNESEGGKWGDVKVTHKDWPEGVHVVGTPSRRNADTPSIKHWQAIDPRSNDAYRTQTSQSWAIKNAQHAASSIERKQSLSTRTEAAVEASDVPALKTIAKDIGTPKTEADEGLLSTVRTAIRSADLKDTKPGRDNFGTMPETDHAKVGETKDVGHALVIGGKHTRKGHDIYTVAAKDRTSREDYSANNALAKQMGGYYSRYRGGGAKPGFIFDDAKTAHEFADKMTAVGKADAPAAAARSRSEVREEKRAAAAKEFDEITEAAVKGPGFTKNIEKRRASLAKIVEANGGFKAGDGASRSGGVEVGHSWESAKGTREVAAVTPDPKTGPVSKEEFAELVDPKRLRPATAGKSTAAPDATKAQLLKQNRERVTAILQDSGPDGVLDHFASSAYDYKNIGGGRELRTAIDNLEQLAAHKGQKNTALDAANNAVKHWQGEAKRALGRASRSAQSGKPGSTSMEDVYRMRSIRDAMKRLASKIREHKAKDARPLPKKTTIRDSGGSGEMTGNDFTPEDVATKMSSVSHATWNGHRVEVSRRDTANGPVYAGVHIPPTGRTERVYVPNPAIRSDVIAELASKLHDVKSDEIEKEKLAKEPNALSATEQAKLDTTVKILGIGRTKVNGLVKELHAKFYAADAPSKINSVNLQHGAPRHVNQWAREALRAKLGSDDLARIKARGGRHAVANWADMIASVAHDKGRNEESARIAAEGKRLKDNFESGPGRKAFDEQANKAAALSKKVNDMELGGKSTKREQADAHKAAQLAHAKTADLHHDSDSEAAKSHREKSRFHRDAESSANSEVAKLAQTEKLEAVLGKEGISRRARQQVHNENKDRGAEDPAKTEKRFTTGSMRFTPAQVKRVMSDGVIKSRRDDGSIWYTNGLILVAASSLDEKSRNALEADWKSGRGGRNNNQDWTGGPDVSAVIPNSQADLTKYTYTGVAHAYGGSSTPVAYYQSSEGHVALLNTGMAPRKEMWGPKPTQHAGFPGDNANGGTVTGPLVDDPKNPTHIQMPVRGEGDDVDRHIAQGENRHQVAEDVVKERPLKVIKHADLPKQVASAFEGHGGDLATLVAGAHDNSLGKKSEHGPAWLPPAGAVIEGEHDGKKYWAMATGSHARVDGSKGDSPAFIVVNEDGKSYKMTGGSNRAMISLRTAMQEAGAMDAQPPAADDKFKLSDRDVKAVFGLNGARFKVGDTAHGYNTGEHTPPRSKAIKKSESDSHALIQAVRWAAA